MTQVLMTVMMVGTLAWLLALIVQSTDVAASLDDLRSARDRELRSDAERRALRLNAWFVCGGLGLVVVLLVGVDLAVRALVDDQDVFTAASVLLGAVLVVLLGVLGLITISLRRQSLSYDVLRATLLESRDRVTKDDIARFRAQLAQIDGYRRNIRFGMRDGAVLAPVRARLDQIAEGFAKVPPTGFDAVRVVRWKTANAYIWRGNIVRLLPVLIALIVGVVASAVGNWELAGLSVIAAALSYLFALVGARAALASKAVWHAMHQRQRLDVVRLIEELERSVRKGVTGLGDRVTRALQILRDQQT